MPTTYTQQPEKWYHASPYDLPVGTVLTPGGGKSPFEHLNESREFRQRAPYVWVSPSLKDAYDWRNWIEEEGNPPTYIYQVEPHSKPDFWDYDTGHSTSGATILEKVFDPHQGKLASHTVIHAGHAPWQKTPEGHFWESDKGIYRVSPYPPRGWRIDYPNGQDWRKARSLADAKELAYRHYKDDPDWASPEDENFGALEKRGLS